MNPPVPTSRWPRRFALAATAAAVPLIAFGGSVTSLEAGMAVEGWLDAEGHFLPFFPVEKWLRDPETFVEHTHRLFGMLVGLLSLATLVLTWRLDRRTSARALATAAFAAVCAQGTIGGLRVLENAPSLAFLHGVIAQAVFALLGVTALVLSRGWSQARRRPAANAFAARRLAAGASLVVLVQSAIGAWYRHGLRHDEVPGLQSTADGRFHLHLLGALVAFAVLLALAAAVVRAAGEDDGSGDPGRRALARCATRIKVLLAVQVGLGMGAWASAGTGAITAGEIVFSVLHVTCGALLLAQCVVTAAWCGRALEHGAASSTAAPSGTGVWGNAG